PRQLDGDHHVTRPVVHLVLVHWNQPERLAATVAAFRASEGVDLAITVVDNASERVPALDDDVELLHAGDNRGFGPGANLGLLAFLDDPAAGEYVAVAPHD